MEGRTANDLDLPCGPSGLTLPCHRVELARSEGFKLERHAAASCVANYFTGKRWSYPVREVAFSCIT